MSSDDEFEAHSGAAACSPIEAGKVRKGGFLVIRGRPCKVLDCSKAQPGKHGSAKCHFTGIDLFTSKKMETVCPASAIMSQPDVSKQDFLLMGCNEDFLALMSTTGAVTRHDLRMPSNDALAAKIEDALQNCERGDALVTVMKAMGCEGVSDIKKATRSGAAASPCDNKKNGRKKK
eukprot:587501-Rhodomonas_salina.2